MSKVRRQARLDHVRAVKLDIRDEIKRRIEQRDKYSIQMTVVLTAVIGVAFSKPGFQNALLAAPLASIYFTVLILYSYRVHGVLARYLREVVDPILAKAAGAAPELEWESYYRSHAAPGIRRRFFLTALWVVTIGSPLCVLGGGATDQSPAVVVACCAAVYGVAAAVITYAFWDA